MIMRYLFLLLFTIGSSFLLSAQSDDYCSCQDEFIGFEFDQSQSNNRPPNSNPALQLFGFDSNWNNRPVAVAPRPKTKPPKVATPQEDGESPVALPEGDGAAFSPAPDEAPIASTSTSPIIPSQAQAPPTITPQITTTASTFTTTTTTTTTSKQEVDETTTSTSETVSTTSSSPRRSTSSAKVKRRKKQGRVKRKRNPRVRKYRGQCPFF